MIKQNRVKIFLLIFLACLNKKIELFLKRAIVRVYLVILITHSAVLYLDQRLY